MNDWVKAVIRIALFIGDKQITDYIFTEVIYRSEKTIILEANDTLFWYDMNSGEKLAEVKNIQKYVKLNNGHLAIKIGGLYGVYSNSGEMILPCEYSYISLYSIANKGHIKVFLDNKQGIYSTEYNKFIIPIEFDNVTSFSPGYYKVKNNNLVGIYSYMGEKIIDAEYYNISISGISDYYIVTNEDGNLGLYHNKDLILPCEYKEINMSKVHGVFELIKDGKLKYFVTGDDKIVEASGISNSAKGDTIMFYKNYKWRDYSEFK